MMAEVGWMEASDEKSFVTHGTWGYVPRSERSQVSI